LGIWQRAQTPEMKAALLVSRVIVALAGLSLFVIAYRSFNAANDPRFVPGVTSGYLDDPKFVLSAFVIAPLGILLLASTIRVTTTWIAVVLVLCAGSIEGLAYLYENRPVAVSTQFVPVTVKSEGPGMWRTDCGRVGTCLAPNSYDHVTATRGDETIYDVVYNIGGDGLRKSVARNGGARRLFAAIFGDSNTFGMNVPEAETLASHIGQIACTVQPYNLASAGGASSNMLAEFEDNLVSTAVKEPAGFMIYVFNDGHIGRNVGDDETLLWGKNFPAYDYDESGAIVYRGTLWTYRPFRNALALLTQKLNITNAMHLHVPPYLSSADVRLTAAIIEKSAALARQQFPATKFIMLIAPGAKLGSDVAHELKDKDIQVLDYSSLISFNTPGLFLPYDGHPSGLFHKLMAGQIVKDLRLGCSAQQ
jgi:hypothetical protein